MKIIDVSYSQGEIDFEKVAESGQVDAVYIRATQGMTIDDDKFKEYHDGFKSVGIPVGAYHFFMFNANAPQQAQHFLAAINGREGELLPMIDVEAESMEGHSSLGDRIQWIHMFNAEILKSFKNILFYTNYSFWNDVMQGVGQFQGHPLWLSEFNNDQNPTLPNGWNTWKIWQYTSKGNVPGINQNFVDLNKFNGESLKEIMQ